MAKLDAMFKRLPPKQPLTTLSSLVVDWNYRFGPKGIEHHRRDHVTDYCARARSLNQAIDRACDSRAENGKMHNHQSRVKQFDRMLFAERIMKAGIRTINDFDELYDLLEKIRPVGIGPVTLYDVATRIAAYKQITVESLYLHAGVRIGWQKLHGARTNLERIPRKDLPKEFKKLPTDEVEDLLCTYRDYLQPWKKFRPGVTLEDYIGD